MLNLSTSNERYVLSKQQPLKFLSGFKFKVPTEETYKETHPDFVADASPPISLTCLLDRSGSMSGNPIALVKKTMHYIIDHMRLGDGLGMVGFESDANVITEMTKIKGSVEKKSLHQGADSLRVGGSTNMSEGLHLAFLQQGGNLTAEEKKAISEAMESQPSQMFGGRPQMNRMPFLAQKLTFPLQQQMQQAQQLPFPLQQQMQQAQQLPFPLQQQMQQAQQLPFPLQQQMQQAQQLPFPLQQQVQQAPQELQEEIPQEAPEEKPEDVDEKAPESDADVHSIFLLTDGYANCGIHQPDRLTEAVQKAMRVLNEKKKCSLFCFGMGASHNEELMKNLVEVGNGMYYFIENIGQIPAAFADALAGIMSVVAQNIEVTIEPVCDGITIKPLETSFKYETVGNGHKYFIPELFFEEEKDILFEIKISDVEKLQKMTEDVEKKLEVSNFLKYTVKYFDALEKKDETQFFFGSVSLTTDPDFSVDHPSNIDQILEEQKNRILAAEAIEKARMCHNYMDAKRVLGEAKQQIMFSAAANTNFSEALVMNLDDMDEEMTSNDHYNHVSKKKMMMVNRNLRRQRGANVGGPVMYESKAQAKLKEKFK